MNCRSIILPARVPAVLPEGTLGQKIAILIGLLYTRTNTPEKWIYGHFINIHSSELRRLLGRKYKDIIKEVAKLGLIEINESYSTGREQNEAFTKSYRIGTEFLTRAATIFSAYLPRDQSRVRKLYSVDPKNLKCAGMHLYKMLCEATTFEIPDNSPLCLRNSRHRLAFTTQNHRMNRCDYFRVHSEVTSMPKKDRKFIRLNGSSVVEADVSACQQLALGVLAAGYEPSNHYQDPRPSDRTNTHMLRTSCLRSGKADVLEWIRLCEDREINAYLHDEVRRLPDPTYVRFLKGEWDSEKRVHKTHRNMIVDLGQFSQSDFKIEAMIPIFTNASALKNNPVFQVIKKRFPSIARFIYESKSGNLPQWSNVKKAPHKRTAALCQRFESLTMIDDVIGVMMREHPDVGVLTIHDALLVPEDFGVRAKAIIENAWASFGVKPKVRLKKIN